MILPESIQKHFLEMSHDGHPGVSKTKAVLRTLVYWPAMNRSIETHVRNCVSCRAFSTRGDNPPLTVVAEEKAEPWGTVAIDLTGPSDLLRGMTLLTMIDLHSRYPEVHILQQATSRTIIDALTASFSQFGLPKSILSDNDTPFTSFEFENFLSINGIKHIRSSNFHPRGNGAIERFHYSLKNRLKKIFHEQEFPLCKAIQKVLYDLRSSPHDVTGETPFSRLFGRRRQSCPMQYKLIPLLLLVVLDQPMMNIASVGTHTRRTDLAILFWSEKEIDSLSFRKV